MDNKDYDDGIEEITKSEIRFCQCGSKVSFGCGDQCRVCFYSANFKSRNIISHLIEANAPSKAARRTAKLALHFKENKNAYPGALLSENFGESMFICGGVGIGKTTFAILNMIHHMEQWNTSKEHFKKGQTFLFESIPSMMFNLRMSMKLSCEEELAAIDRYKNVDFLILDDFGVEKSSDWAFSVLYLIISHRYEEEKQTIFTSNFDLDQLAEKNNDERLTRRISDWCKIIHLTR